MRLLLALALLPTVLNAYASDFAWHRAPDLGTRRGAASASVLPGGREVLVAGGSDGRTMLSSTEIFDGRAWRPGQDMHDARAGHSAVRLADGRILVVGGGVAAAETYAEEDGWSDVAPLPLALTGQVAVELPDSEVLVTGGASSPGQLNRRTFIFDPVNDRWREAPATLSPHNNGRATLLRTGQVLLAGGVPGNQGQPGVSAELYDNRSGQWSPTGAMIVDRTAFALVQLGDGSVLAAGGITGETQFPTLLRAAEVYSPSAHGWRGVAPMRVSRAGAIGLPLSDGSALVASGAESRTGEIYDPRSASWQWLPGLSSNHTGGAGAALSGDRAVLAGGFDGSSADLLQPGAALAATRATTQTSGTTVLLGLVSGLLLAAVAIQTAWRRRSP